MLPRAKTRPAAAAPPEQIYSQLKARQGGLSAFAAKGRLTLISPGQNATGTALIKGKFPETLRVDVKDPLGRAALSFFTDGQTVEVLFPGKTSFSRARPHPPTWPRLSLPG